MTNNTSSSAKKYIAICRSFTVAFLTLWTDDLLSKADERGTEYEEPNQQAQHQKTQEHHAAPPVPLLLSNTDLIKC